MNYCADGCPPSAGLRGVAARSDAAASPAVADVPPVITNTVTNT